MFDEIPDKVIATIPKINSDDIPNKVKVMKNKCVKDAS
jgi:MoaA/NifB/PqqE/SkfB family radical SAM enzyme